MRREKTPTGIVCNWRETSDYTVVPEIDAAVSDIPGTPASQLHVPRGSTNSEGGSAFAELFIRQKEKEKKRVSGDRIIRGFIGHHRVGVWTSVRCAVQSSSLLPRVRQCSLVELGAGPSRLACLAIRSVRCYGNRKQGSFHPIQCPYAGPFAFTSAPWQTIHLDLPMSRKASSDCTSQPPFFFRLWQPFRLRNGLDACARTPKVSHTTNTRVFATSGI